MKKLIVVCLSVALIASSCEQSNSLDSQTAMKYFLSACDKERAKDTLGAMREYSKVIDINPNDTKASYKSTSYSNRGLLKFGLKDYRGAIEDFNSAITLGINTKSGFNYYYRGWAKGNLKDTDGAIQDYNKAIEIDPKDIAAYENRGFLKIEIGQKNSGCLDLSKAGELGDEGVYKWIKQYCQ